VFTGIVEEVGEVRATGPRLKVAAAKVAADTGPGDSVAVNGVCLTVVERRQEAERAVLGFDLSPETRARTTLGRLRPADPVNLERPVTLLARLGGHLVQGHVDAVGEVAEVRETPPGREVAIRLPEGLGRYMAEKGSIAVDGVSLTVAGVGEGWFRVALVPHTLAATTLGGLRVGDPVNLEVDLIAKYVERLVAPERAGGPR
jgi:riboflavin synthase